MRTVTLFVNRTCSLCARARSALQDLPFPVRVREVDVSSSSNPTRDSADSQEIRETRERQETRWKVEYVFDVPVIHLTDCGTSKLMHWIHKDDLLAKFREADGPATGWHTTCGKKR